MTSSAIPPTPAPVAPSLLTAALPTPTTLRAELEDLVVKELLGPAGGPDEEVDESRASDRYLVGILAPRRTVIRAAESEPLASDGAGTVEDGSADDLALPMDSLAPAAIGLTCTVQGECENLSVTASWGRYSRERSATITTPTGNPKMVWKRYPMGGKPLMVPLKEGDIAATPADTEQPDVVLRGRVRKLDGDWVVSLFLVNAQLSATRRPKDDELVFQPEMRVSSADGKPIFRKRRRRSTLVDAEQLRLEMLYRRHVEFAVGHGVAVDARVSAEAPTEAVELLTRVTPSYEVPVTTPPTAEDNPALAAVMLDMQQLAEMPETELLQSLRALTDSYADWIARNQARVEAGADELADFVAPAREAMDACGQARQRIEAGISLLASDPKAMRAFRFANRAMWQQRIHTLFSERKRAGVASTLDELDLPANRSWRPFQLAFVLLNLPGVTGLDHPDRGESAAAVADLLWFPTGGGKTEAYLGLTAYTLALRRLQGVVGGRLGHAGVAVIMRYTLRLLTLQQFQRAAALICACEVTSTPAS